MIIKESTSSLTSSGDESYFNSTTGSDNSSVQLPVRLENNIIPPSVFGGNIEVINATGIHFGNKAVYNGPVTVNQFINNTEGQETAETNYNTTTAQNVSINLKSLVNRNWYRNILQNRKILRVASFIIITIIMLLSSILIFIFLSSNDDSKIRGSLGKVPYYKRNDWLGQPVAARNYELFKNMPLDFVIITSTAPEETQECFNKTQCSFMIRKLQNLYIETWLWGDIGYNFLVGGDGGIYEGRGWNIMGAHTYNYNQISLGIGLIGTFMHSLPTEKQLIALKTLIEEGIRLNKISKDYKLLGQCQVSNTTSPGTKFYNQVLKNWPKWTRMNTNFCL